jgi:hypothetical protein
MLTMTSRSISLFPHVATQLVQKSKRCLDYIVLHELAHLRLPSHGSRPFSMPISRTGRSVVPC